MSCGLLALSVEKGFLRHNCRPAHGAGLLVWWGVSLCAFLSTLPCAAQPSAALTPVVLQLKWTHAFQFAGYYMAEELGYYRDAGLEVRIVEAGQGQNPVDEVVAGRAQFGVGASSTCGACGWQAGGGAGCCPAAFATGADCTRGPFGAKRA
ncbi:MAG: ABC transporter substrate-binding protein [Thauera sp.]|nr:ABC transporter substrate-binding protein [Thauera sp.]